MKRILTNVARSIHYNYKDGGLRQIAGRVVARVRQLFIDRTDYLIYQTAPRATSGPESSHRGLPLQREELDFERLVELQYFKAIYYPEGIRGRFQAGERCHGFFVDEQLANIAWSTRGVLNVDPHLSIECEDGAGIYDCWTMAEFRGRGIYPESLRMLLARFSVEGCGTVLIAVDPDNIRSIKGIERAGFLPLKRVKTTVRLGKRLVRSESFSLRVEGAEGRGAG
ncbi:MAG: GNAT family N-acetyltransferase [Bryobacterales bacterium]|nr:GNAT family N-acetyltransferase [Bryobacterales bacterium]